MRNGLKVFLLLSSILVLSLALPRHSYAAIGCGSNWTSKVPDSKALQKLKDQIIDRYTQINESLDWLHRAAESGDSRGVRMSESETLSGFRRIEQTLKDQKEAIETLAPISLAIIPKGLDDAVQKVKVTAMARFFTQVARLIEYRAIFAGRAGSKFYASQNFWRKDYNLDLPLCTVGELSGFLGLSNVSTESKEALAKTLSLDETKPVLDSSSLNGTEVRGDQIVTLRLGAKAAQDAEYTGRMRHQDPRTMVWMLRYLASNALFQQYIDMNPFRRNPNTGDLLSIVPKNLLDELGPIQSTLESRHGEYEPAREEARRKGLIKSFDFFYGGHGLATPPQISTLTGDQLKALNQTILDQRANHMEFATEEFIRRFKALVYESPIVAPPIPEIPIPPPGIIINDNPPAEITQTILNKKYTLKLADKDWKEFWTARNQELVKTLQEDRAKDWINWAQKIRQIEHLRTKQFLEFAMQNYPAPLNALERETLVNSLTKILAQAKKAAIVAGLFEIPITAADAKKGFDQKKAYEFVNSWTQYWAENLVNRKAIKKWIDDSVDRNPTTDASKAKKAYFSRIIALSHRLNLKIRARTQVTIDREILYKALTPKLSAVTPIISDLAFNYSKAPNQIQARSVYFMTKPALEKAITDIKNNPSADPKHQKARLKLAETSLKQFFTVSDYFGIQFSHEPKLQELKLGTEVENQYKLLEKSAEIDIASILGIKIRDGDKQLYQVLEESKSWAHSVSAIQDALDLAAQTIKRNLDKISAIPTLTDKDIQEAFRTLVPLARSTLISTVIHQNYPGLESYLDELLTLAVQPIDHGEFGKNIEILNGPMHKFGYLLFVPMAAGLFKATSAISLGIRAFEAAVIRPGQPWLLAGFAAIGPQLYLQNKDLKTQASKINDLEDFYYTSSTRLNLLKGEMIESQKAELEIAQQAYRSGIYMNAAFLAAPIFLGGFKTILAEAREAHLGAHVQRVMKGNTIKSIVIASEANSSVPNIFQPGVLESINQKILDAAGRKSLAYLKRISAQNAEEAQKIRKILAPYASSLWFKPGEMPLNISDINFRYWKFQDAYKTAKTQSYLGITSKTKELPALKLAMENAGKATHLASQLILANRPASGSLDSIIFAAKSSWSQMRYGVRPNPPQDVSLPLLKGLFERDYMAVKADPAIFEVPTSVPIFLRRMLPTQVENAYTITGLSRKATQAEILAKEREIFPMQGSDKANQYIEFKASGLSASDLSTPDLARDKLIGSFSILKEPKQRRDYDDFIDTLAKDRPVDPGQWQPNKSQDGFTFQTRGSRELTQGDGP